MFRHLMKSCLMVVLTAFALVLAAPSPALAFFSETFNTEAAADFNDTQPVAYGAWSELGFQGGDHDADFDFSVVGGRLMGENVGTFVESSAVRNITVPAAAVAGTPIIVEADLQTSAFNNGNGYGLVVSNMTINVSSPDGSVGGSRGWPDWASDHWPHVLDFVPVANAMQHWKVQVSPQGDGSDIIDLTITEGANTHNDSWTTNANSRFEYSGNQLQVGFWITNFQTPIPNTKYDNLTVTLVGAGSTATTFTWTADGLGDWAISSNWTFTGGNPSTIANSPNHTAVFADLVSGATNVSTIDHVTVNRIVFDNTTHGYVVSGHGSVNLASTTAPMPVSPTMSVTGTHRFQAAVNLLNDTTINTADSSTLIFDGSIDLMGNTLTKTGAGSVAFNNKITTGSGMVNCAEGTCSGTGTIAGDLNNGGGTISPGDIAAASGSPEAVPEPATWLLCCLGLLGLLPYIRPRR